MKKFLLTLCIALTLLTAGVLTACQKEYRYPTGYDMIVTYDANGGLFGEYEQVPVYYLPGSPVLEPGEVTELALPTMANHTLVGWFLAETDDNGEPRKDDAGNVILAEQWDFSLPAQESMTLYAKWQTDRKIVVVDAPDGDSPNTEYPLTEAGLSRPYRDPKKSGYTFLDYYYHKDEDGNYTDRVTWPVLPQEGSDEDIYIYCKYIEGTWNVVRTENDLFDSKIAAGGNVYFDVPDNVLDFTSATKTWKTPAAGFKGKFYGNGVTIKGLKATDTHGNFNASADSFGFFGELHDGAEIRDVAFESCDVTVELMRAGIRYVGWLSGRAESGVRIENVTIDATLTLKKQDDVIVQYGNTDLFGNVLALDEQIQGLIYENVTATIGVVESSL